MPSLVATIRSLGNAGAVANTTRVLEERRRQEWAVRVAARHVAAIDAAAARAAVLASPVARSA